MDLFDLSNKIAIITGGNGGIGLGMARRKKEKKKGRGDLTCRVLI
jgi:NAD(P)-dependent dehydrogenase (short-subunit alcohol dehydrogenase family)